MYDYIISNGYIPVIVATKLDKIKRSQYQKNIKNIKNCFANNSLTVLPFSALTKAGKEEIQNYVRTCNARFINMFSNIIDNKSIL